VRDQPDPQNPPTTRFTGSNQASALHLRPPVPDDESQLEQAQSELAADNFRFAFVQPGESWTSFAARVEQERLGIDIPPDWVPSTFLVAEVGSDIVGRSSIRHELNDHLASVGGHIGYAVRPAFRRRGYARAILRQSLVVAGDLGIRHVLITCDDDNVASIRTIESCGGMLENVVDDPGSSPKRRYWISQPHSA
jgi:predicted acetyltransferase